MHKVLKKHAEEASNSLCDDLVPMSPVAILDQVKQRRAKVLESCRTSMVLEMKRAQEERDAMQSKVKEVTGLKAHLMMAKVDEIINDVVAPERQRALEETEEVTRSTLSAATLPSQVCEPQTKLSEEDNSALLRMAGELQRDELEASSAAMALREAEISAMVSEESRTAVNWAHDRQAAAMNRNMLHQKRMQVEVAQGCSKLEQARSAAERLKSVVKPQKKQVEQHECTVTETSGSPRGQGPLSQPLNWNQRNQNTLQPVVKDAVIGKITVDLGRNSGPVVVQ